MTKVKDIIDIGETIADDVTRVADRQDDGWARVGDGIPGGVWQCDKGQIGDVRSGDVLAFEWGPLTVTAVREPEPDDVVHYRLPGADRTLCGLDPWMDDDTVIVTERAGSSNCTACRAAADEGQPKSRTVRVTMALDIEERDGKAVISTHEGEIGSCDSAVFLATVAKEFGVTITPTSGPSVLSLPQVPPGTVALVVQFKGQEIRFEPYVEGGWIRTDWEGESWDLPALLEEFGPARVVMREPRTWPRLDTISNDLKAVRGASGKVYHRSHFSQSVPVFRERGNDGDPLAGPGHMFYALQTFDGPLTEVFEDEPGGEPR